MSTEPILIADTSGEFRDSLVAVLNNKGFSTILSSSGSETLKLVTRSKPSLVVLELLLPDLSGEDICKILKTDPNVKQIPIMIVTSKNDLQSKLDCLELGVEEYLVKPVEPEELAARIVRFFKLMKEWKAAKSSGIKERKVKSHTDTTADIGSLTNPTLNLPAEKSKENVEVQPKPQEKTDKSGYGVYRTESVAGTGGMGLVYKAYDQSLDRYVAVKVLSKEWANSPEFLERFRREAKLIATLNHPGIAQIYTFAQQEGESYFALQWCPGGSLANLIRSSGKINLLAAVDIVEQCAKALEAAWGKSVVHRDIKPSNLMFDENQQVKIVDFGISSSEHMPDNSGRSSVVVGSPAFISPEQGRGQTTDHRTDIYSLGITFYQMLYGRLPFSAKTPQEFLDKHCNAPFPSYDSLEGTIPRGAYKIIERMTQKLPASRYQKYADLIKDLEKVRRELYSQRRLKIPAVQNLDSSPTLRGTNFFDVLSNIFRSEKSGLLRVSWGSLEKEFLILRDEIVHFQSPQTDENVWSELVSKKLMKKEDMPTDHKDFEESLNRLLYLGLLNPEDFKTVFREIMSQSFMQIFLWPVFEGRFYQGKIEHDPLARVSLPQILMKAVRTLVPFESIQDSIPQEGLIVRTPKFEERLRTLNLSRDENFLVSRIEGENNSIQTLQVLTGFDSEQVARIVHVLERTGVVKYESALERKQRRNVERSFTSQPPVVENQNPVGQKVEEVRKNVPAEKPKGWVDAAPQPDLKLASRNYKQAESKYKAGSYWEVVRLCGQAIQNNPKEASYHYLMALALMNFPHSVRAAVESFRQAVQLDQTNVQYRLQLVNFLRDKNQFQEAYRECEKLLLLSPSNKQAAILLRQIELEK